VANSIAASAASSSAAATDCFLPLAVVCESIHRVEHGMASEEQRVAAAEHQVDAGSVLPLRRRQVTTQMRTRAKRRRMDSNLRDGAGAHSSRMPEVGSRVSEPRQIRIPAGRGARFREVDTCLGVLALFRRKG
jgi:hypothetical protein